jgi:hypothetical protein
MNENTHAFRHWRWEGILVAVSAGFFFIIVGTLFATRPALYDSLRTFLNPDSWTNRTINNSTIVLPVPKNPSSYAEIYNAALAFSLAWGIFQVLVLTFRFVIGSSARRKARTVQSAVFWLGVSYLINTYLIIAYSNADAAQQGWFLFWAAVIILIGLALIARAIALALLRAR